MAAVAAVGGPVGVVGLAEEGDAAVATGAGVDGQAGPVGKVRVRVVVGRRVEAGLGYIFGRGRVWRTARGPEREGAGEERGSRAVGRPDGEQGCPGGRAEGDCHLMKQAASSAKPEDGLFILELPEEGVVKLVVRH